MQREREGMGKRAENGSLNGFIFAPLILGPFNSMCLLPPPPNCPLHPLFSASPVNLMKSRPIAFSINIPIWSGVNNKCFSLSFFCSVSLPLMDDVESHLLCLWCY